MDIFKAFSRLDYYGKQKLWKKIKAESAQYPETLVRIPCNISMPSGGQPPKEAWRSRGYLVQIYEVNDQWERMSVNKVAFNAHFTRFLDGITWERLQELKAECGRGHCEAVEIFPTDDDVVNVANLRHLWIKKSGSIIEEEGIGWKNANAKAAEPSSVAANTAQEPACTKTHSSSLQSVSSAG